MSSPLQFLIDYRRQSYGRSGLTRRPPRWLYPELIEGEYRLELRSAVIEMNTLIERELLSRLLQMSGEAELYRPDVRSDDWIDHMNETMATLALQVFALFVRPAGVAQVIAEKVAWFNKAQLNRITSSVLGVDVFLAEPWLAQELKAFSSQNAKLIKSIPEKHLADVEEIAMRGLRSGQRAEEIATEIRARFNVPKNRAEFIAADQVGKLNGQLTMLRQQEIGVDEYTWRTSKDERVRHSHRLREGKKIAWKDPPSDGHPGEPYRCRCYAEPVLDHLIQGNK